MTPALVAALAILVARDSALAVALTTALTPATPKETHP